MKDIYIIIKVGAEDSANPEQLRSFILGNLPNVPELKDLTAKVIPLAEIGEKLQDVTNLIPHVATNDQVSTMSLNAIRLGIGHVAAALNVTVSEPPKRS
jgi:hypothetical protein